MTPALFVGLCLAGGVGAALRFVVDGLVRERTSGTYPVGTTLINLSGSLLLGLVTGLAASAVVSDDLRLVLGTGLLGGYTTFSTHCVETVRLAQERRWRASTLNALGTLVLGVALAGLGYALGSAG
ncbi:hypothetical protein GCM10011519_27990 [Marmoricola endophyticus]|uniref:Fluoride-specific ion channel FluC n=1 Tax=Marmoricola endophyticus TaxID=2040280 RepID=A0A917F709_9ACTN|nr:fluoride efflux transporter CrcB [Marmoricola endophyticus]GGF52430.1 hypothetical protein GCM10011519_27990 [Marmoricola endophyticus]